MESAQPVMKPLAKLQKHRTTLLEVLECDNMFLANLYSAMVIDECTYQEIISPNKTNYARNQLLLKSLMSSNNTDEVYKGFISALEADKQSHIENLLDSKTGPLPLSLSVREKIKKVRPLAAKEMIVTGILAPLRSLEVILNRHEAIIKQHPSEDNKSLQLIDIVLRRSDKAFRSFCDTLIKTGQAHVSKILETPAETIVPVHASGIAQENEAAISDGVNEFIMASVEGRSADQDILSDFTPLGLQLCGSQCSESIVFFVICKDMDSLHKLEKLGKSGKMKEYIQKLINLVKKDESLVNLTIKIMQKDCRRSRNYFIDQHPLSDFIKEKERFIDMIQQRAPVTNISPLFQEELDLLKNENNIEQSIIGTVGRTGLGKSSLLNALLRCGNILPSSAGERACTATAVKISASLNDNYEADITFFNEEEWAQEVETRDIIQQEYPNCGLKSLPEYNAELILSNYSRMSCNDCNTFIEQVGPFISRDFESDILPYVKCVNIHIPVLQSPILRNVTFVDLPGTGESGQKQAVTDRNCKQLDNCNAIWIITEILRAADNDSRDIIDEKFCRKLLMDGSTGAVSFICTKTDVIDLKAKEYQKCDFYVQQKAKIDQLIDEIKKKEDDDDKELPKTEQKKSEKSELELREEKRQEERKLRNSCALIRNERCKTFLLGSINEMVRNIIKDEECSKNVEAVSVFCVSSNDYITLKNRSIEDSTTFANVTETGIPDLLKHTEKLVNDKVEVLKNRQIRKLCWLLKKVIHPHYISIGQEVGNNLQYLLAEEGKLLSEKLRTVCDSVMQEVDGKKIKLDLAIRDAVNNVYSRFPDICNQWSRKCRANTYAAIVKRDGKFASISTDNSYDFNEDLLTLFTEPITREWVALYDIPFKKFEERVLEVLKGCYNSLGEKFSQYQSEFSTSKLPEFTEFQIKDDIERMQNRLRNEKRSILRKIKSYIKFEMIPAYNRCKEKAQRGGTGVYIDMLGEMRDYLAQNGHSMFQVVGSEMTNKVAKLLKQLAADMKLCCDHLIKDFSQMYDPVVEPSHTRESLDSVLQLIEPLESLYQHINTNVSFPELDDLRKERDKLKSGSLVNMEVVASRYDEEMEAARVDYEEETDMAIAANSLMTEDDKKSVKRPKLV